MSTPATFEAHGHTWTSHTPGDPMPCDDDAFVFTLYRCMETAETEAAETDWGKFPHCDHVEIIGWRYADATPPQEKDELPALSDSELKSAEEQAVAEMAILKEEGIREKAFIEARRGIHELHSPEGELIAKFQWEEEKGDPDVGMPGWACWVVTDDSPEVVLKSEHEDELTRLREENESMRTAIQSAITSFEYIQSHEREFTSPELFYWNALNQSRAALANLQPFTTESK